MGEKRSVCGVSIINIIGRYERREIQQLKPGVLQCSPGTMVAIDALIHFAELPVLLLFAQFALISYSDTTLYMDLQYRTRLIVKEEA